MKMANKGGSSARRPMMSAPPKPKPKPMKQKPKPKLTQTQKPYPKYT